MTNYQIIVPPETHILPSDHPRINLREIIPDHYDITGIHIDFPHNLKHIVIEIGGINSIVFDKDMTEYMKTFPIYLTLCKYMDVMISFIYDTNWIDSNTEYEILDEYTKQDVLGKEVTIWDGYEYHKGEIVLESKNIPTGKHIRKVTKSIEVLTPTIIFDIEEINYNMTSLSQNIIQKIDISNISNDDKKRLIEQFNLNIIGTGIGYIDNKILYRNGMAKLYYNY